MRVLFFILFTCFIEDGASLLSAVAARPTTQMMTTSRLLLSGNYCQVHHISFRHRKTICVYMSVGSSHFIEWPETRTLTFDHQASLSDVLVRRGEFCKLEALPASRTKEIKKKVSDVSQWRGLSEDVVFDQAKSLRTQMLAEKVCFSSHRLRGDKIPLCYETGNPVQKISRDWDVAPVAVIRAVLKRRCAITFPRLQRRIQHFYVKEALRGVEIEGLELSSRDREELAWSKDQDCCTWEDKAYTAEREKRAAEFEKILHDYLDASSIPFRSEQDIRSEYDRRCAAIEDTSVHSPPAQPPTPDVVLSASEVQLTINGERIHWIDAKSYYGAAAQNKKSLFLKKIRKQADRYNHEWGKGAIVYKMGFCNRLQNQIGAGALVLDSSALTKQLEISSLI